LAGGCTLEAPCRTDLAAATPKTAHLGRALRESDVRSGEAVPVITGGPTLAVATTLIIPDSIREMGKVLSAVTAAAGKGHKDVVPRPPANGQSTTVPARAQWSSCPHPAEMSRRAFTPAGSRKCGGESWRKEDDNCYSHQSSPRGRKLQGGGKGGQPPYGDSRCGEYPTSISVSV
jgi:hypothetical protein